VIVLGIKGVEGIFHDASAKMIKDNAIIASVEEERLNRRKHTNGLPLNAIYFCLKKAKVGLWEIDHVGHYLDPTVLRHTFLDEVVRRFRCSARPLQYYVNAAKEISQIENTLRET